MSRDDMCDHDWQPGRHGEMCAICGVLRSEVEAPPTQLVRQKKRKGIKLKTSGVTVVPHVLQTVADAETLVAMELEYVRKKRAQMMKDGTFSPMDLKELKGLEILAKTARNVYETRVLAEEREAEGLSRKSDEELDNE